MHLPRPGRPGRTFAGLTMYLTPEELLSFLPGQSVIELTNDDPRGTEPDMGKVGGSPCVPPGNWWTGISGAVTNCRLPRSPRCFGTWCGP